MIDVSGFLMHYYCLGAGKPTVILEAGMADDSRLWTLVQDEVAQFTHVLSYDRAGLGWSAGHTDPPTSPFIAQRLHNLLQAAQVFGPYVLVGFSLGGIFLRRFAFEYPGEVAGMVLIDSSHERLTIHVPWWDMAIRWSAVRYEALAQAPHEQRMAALARQPHLQSWPAHLLQAFIETLTPENLLAMAREMKSHTENTGQNEILLQSLGDMPLMVLEACDRDRDLAGFSTEKRKEFLTTWHDFQLEFTKLSTHSEHRLIDSGHNIPMEAPQTVVDAIRDVVHRVRNKAC